MDGDCKKILNWELGFVLKINWELGLGTPHQDPHIGTESVERVPDLLELNCSLPKI